MNLHRHKTHVQDGLRAVLALCVLVVLTLVPAAVAAGTFQITPVLEEVAVDESTATFRIRNSGQSPLTVQVNARRWTQTPDEDILTDASELIVVPPLVKIAPGQEQVIRIAHKRRDKARELAYRVQFQEVATAAPPGFAGIQTVVMIDVPLFFTTAASDDVLRISTRRTAQGRQQLVVANTGKRFARLNYIRLQDQRGKVVAELDGPLYALAGTTRRWDLPESTQLPANARLVAVLGSGGKQETVPLTVE